MTAPCAPWILPADIPDVTDEDVALLAIDAATFVLWALAGRRHGLCETTIRPCAATCVDPGLRTSWHRWGTPWRPVLYDGEWLNLCGHLTSCSCGPISEIVLPDGPVGEVTQVRIGADVLVAGTDYRVDENRLVRLEGRWPWCQDMLAAPGTDGAFDVTYTYGVPVDAMGLAAVTEFARQIALAIAGDGKCRLPARVTSLARQGVQMTLLDPQDFLAQGRTGLYLADLWLASVNPDGLSRPSGVYSPDVPRVRRA